MDHGVGVDLTHVPASVALLDAVEVEVPLVLAWPGQGDPGVAGDHVVVDGEDGLGIHSNPGNLRQTSNMFCFVFKMFHKILHFNISVNNQQMSFILVVKE